MRFLAARRLRALESCCTGVAADKLEVFFFRDDDDDDGHIRQFIGGTVVAGVFHSSGHVPSSTTLHGTFPGV